MLFLLILLIGLLAQFFLPWWIIAVVAFGLASWKGTSAGGSFLAGFAGIALGWLSAALWLNMRNDGILASRIAQVFTLPNVTVLVLVTVLVGGLVGGMAAWSGYFFRKWIGN
jgi:hypothetical protein